MEQQFGSPLGPTLAFIFLSSHEEIWLKNGPCEYKPLIYKRYVDDMLIEIILKNFYVTLIANILILSLHLRQKKAILYRFLIFKLEGLTIVFSQLFIMRQHLVEVSGILEVSYKSNLIFTLIFRAFKLCSNFDLFHKEILNLKVIFKRNGDPVSKYF